MLRRIESIPLLRVKTSALGLLVAAGLIVSGCARREQPQRLATPAPQPPAPPVTPSVDPRYGTSPSPRVTESPGRATRGGGTYKIGQPYQIAGRWYVPRHEPDYDRTGIASFYAHNFHGRKTANGEVFDMNALTAAHPTLPMPSYAYVTNLANGRTILVRINDRGPYAHDRIIDLSLRSARALGFERQGLARVRVRYAGPAPLDGNDSREEQFLAEQSSPKMADRGPVPPVAQPSRHDPPALPHGLTWRR